MTAMPRKRVHYFGKTKSEGTREMKELLGGKGANLAEMTSIGLPVPPGFTITTRTCAEYNEQGGRLPEELMDEVRKNMAIIEKEIGKEFGSESNPLLVSMFGTIRGDTESLIGGGPIEALIRIMTQKNLMSELDMGWIAEGVVRWTDLLLQSAMVAVTHFAPNFSSFNSAAYLAEGYDISGHMVATQAMTCCSYILVMAVVGYFFMKTREIAA